MITANAEARSLVARSIETGERVIALSVDRETLRGLRALALTYGGAVETYETTHGITRKYHDAEERWFVSCTNPKKSKGNQG